MNEYFFSENLYNFVNEAIAQDLNMSKPKEVSAKQDK